MNSVGRWVISCAACEHDVLNTTPAGRPSDEEVTLTRMLDKIIRRSDAVDKESLCVVAGQRVRTHIAVLEFHNLSIRRGRDLQVWHIRLTIHCLADAGNLLDCACLAGIVALKHFRRPEVEVVGDEITVVRSIRRSKLGQVS